MLHQTRILLGLVGLLSVLNLPLLAYATTQQQQQKMTLDEQTNTIAQTRPVPAPLLEGRGVAHGSVFNRGQNVNVSLTVSQGRFTFNMAQAPGTRNRTRYQGTVARQTPGTSANSFVLDGRVQTFDSSASNRIFNNTTGTCRIEVFDARVISSTCRSVAPDSTTQFLGLEQF